MAWSIRLRGPGGQHTLTGLSPEMNVAEFQQQVAGPTGIAPDRQEFRSGFPPAHLAIPPDAKATSILTWGLKQGDTVVVSAAALQAQPLNDADLAQMTEDEMMARAIAVSLGEAPPPGASHQKPSYSAPAPATASAGSRSVTNAPESGTFISRPLSGGRHVVRRVVDSDNSCLFNAVGYNLERSRKVAPRLRHVVALAVKADPVTFNEGFLGKDNEDYQKWIQDPQKWGGGIELYILSRHFQVEIAAYDIQTQRVDVYGQECGYKQRCMLVYDGLHYDALAVCASPIAPESADCTLFDVDSPDIEEVSAGAADVVAKMNAARKFTDTANFTLRCGVCLIGLKGEKEAVQHAKATGHQNFQEY